MSLTDLLSMATEATAIGAELVATMAPGERTMKGDRDYASEVDYAVERKVRAFLADRTPSIGFVGEEYGADRVEGPGRYWWALDPIDGTVNFAHGLPMCAVSLALFDGDRPVVGVVELPFLGHRYTAAEGFGAFRGEQRLAVSTVEALSDAVVTIGDYVVGDDAERKNDQRLHVTRQLAGTVQRIRMLGSAAIDLVWLAEGRTDCSITLSNTSWDIGAGVVIAREAGAVVFDADGSPHTTSSSATIATSPQLRAALLGLMST